MSDRPYILQPGEKVTQVMIGTADLLVWGDLITKDQIRVGAYLTTLAEDFVPLHDAKTLYLAPAGQTAPVDRRLAYVKLEEILFFYAMSDQEPLPEETETRHYEPVELLIGSFQIEGAILKSPIAALHNLLLVAKEAYMSIYKARVCHMGKPWLGTFSSKTIQVRRDRLIVTVR
jgi:hypothetical protein